MHLGFDLRYYILLLRRRLVYILIPFVVVLAACVSVSLLLTPTYRATGTILVEAQQMPDDLVRSTVTNAAGERIGIIKQRVMRRENLLRIAKKFNLFPSEDLSGNAATVVDAMDRAVTVEPVKDDVGGYARSGGTMAFSVSFDHADPDVAYAVANELVSLFLQENVRNRTTRAAETTAFLTQESRKLKKQVDDIGTRIAQYKELHRAALPSLQDLTLTRLEQARTSLQRTEQEIETAESDRRLLTIQLSAAKSGMTLANGPYSTQGGRLTPLQELEQLQTELLEKSAIYDPSHPDIVSLKRKISHLKAQYGVQTGRAELTRRLRDLEAQLKDAKGRYAQNHPDVRRLQSEIKVVQSQIAKAPKAGPSAAAAGGGLTDPTSAHVAAQIEATDQRLASLRKQRDTLKSNIADMEKTTEEAPMVERGLNALDRDYKTAVRKYEEIKAKEMEAQLAQSLEEDKQAERLTLLDSPVRPEKPIKPNRLKILAFGLALAFAAGGGGLLFAEAMDGSIRGATGYRATMKSSPYVVIPYITTAAETRRRQMFLTGSLAGIAVLAVVGLLVFHLYIKPLDEIVFGIIGRLA